MELFPKTQINNHGNDEHGGIIWEWDPVRHREVAKKLSPAFSGRALKAKEPTLHKYIDLFVERMKSLGSTPRGVSLPTWVNWLCVDISADMAYNREMNALKDSKLPCLILLKKYLPWTSEGTSIPLPSERIQQSPNSHPSIVALPLSGPAQVHIFAFHCDATAFPYQGS